MKRARPLQSTVLGKRRAGAGFTLVELMVALTGGLFLSIVVFALARDTGRFYQQETRIANATLSGSSGFDRLSSDLARAGHLMSPNITNDPRVCNRPAANAGWPALLQNLRGLVITPGGSTVTGTELAAAGIAPMSVVIAGALDSTEELPIRTITPNNAGGWSVFLQSDDIPAMTRLAFSAGGDSGAVSDAALSTMFMGGGSGRVVRIVDKEGMEQYGIVSGVTAGPPPVITLAGTPGLLFRTSAPGSPLCGFKGFNTGATINVVNFVRYDIQRLRGVGSTGYEALYAASDAGPFESGRTELVRVELDPSGNAIAGTRELVSEYAVDLQLNPLGATNLNTPAIVPIPANQVTITYNATQLLRAVRVRLSVRSREADRQADVPGAGAGLYRIGLGASGAAPFARVRTFQADIALRNLEGSLW